MIRTSHGVSNPPQRETPPGLNPAARAEREWRESGSERVGTLPVLSLRGYYGQPHLLTEGPADEAPYGMGLPTGSFHHFLEGGSVRPFQQIDHLGGLAAFAHASLFNPGLFPALGRFLRRAGLLSRLPLLGRNV